MGKKTLTDLAILGGRPFTDVKLFVGCPNIGNREHLLRRINDLLDRRQLTNHGPYVEELERRVAAFTGVRHALAVCNATLGLELVLRALDLQGEVIVPSMTFIATAHALQWHGLTPVFCDIDPATHNLDPQQVERLHGARNSYVSLSLIVEIQIHQNLDVGSDTLAEGGQLIAYGVEHVTLRIEFGETISSREAWRVASRFATGGIEQDDVGFERRIPARNDLAAERDDVIK